MNHAKLDRDFVCCDGRCRGMVCALAQRGTTQQACDLPTRLNAGLLIQVADHDGAPLPYMMPGRQGRRGGRA
ncbi:hypothetical protein HC928_11865 [bacterium]|nr:hypothetical protein [bacterium]